MIRTLTVLVAAALAGTAQPAAGAFKAPIGSEKGSLTAPPGSRKGSVVELIGYNGHAGLGAN